MDIGLYVLSVSCCETDFFHAWQDPMFGLPVSRMFIGSILRRRTDEKTSSSFIVFSAISRNACRMREQHFWHFQRIIHSSSRVIF
jgi:hypothetical protein